MPLDILHCDTASDLAKIVHRGARYDAQLGGVDCRRLGMGDYLIKVAPTATKGNAARFLALRMKLLAAGV